MLTATEPSAVQAPTEDALEPSQRAPRMRLRVETLKNRFPSPWEMYSLFLLTGAAIYIPLSYVTSWLPPVHSPLRYVGTACPFCGGTRAVTALFVGQPLLALKYNPLAIGFLAFLFWGAFSWFALVLPRRKRVVLVATKQQRRMLWAAFVLVCLANWAYVVWAGMYEVPLNL